MINLPMTREQAFNKSRHEGCRISHRYFSDDEWLVVHVKCSIEEFNRDRTGESWDTGWYVKTKFTK